MSSLNDEFPHIEGLRYLNHAAVAPWPRRATEAVSAFRQIRREPLTASVYAEYIEALWHAGRIEEADHMMAEAG